MRLTQIVLTKNSLGQYKLVATALILSGSGQTTVTYRGECWYILWKLFRLMPKLKAYRADVDAQKPASDQWKAANKCRPT